MARFWTCGCGERRPRTSQRCATCGKRRPAPRRPKHQLVLEFPYELWVEKFGEQCGICGRAPARYRLHRDHDHTTGKPRGLLCHLCNRALPSWVTIDWLRNAITYLERDESFTEEMAA